jgi:hypothetical protein
MKMTNVSGEFLDELNFFQVLKVVMELITEGESDIYILSLFSVILLLNYNVGLILYLCSFWSCYKISTIFIMKKKFVFTAGLFFQCITSF